METFLRAYLKRVFPDRDVKISVGLFGDLIGNVQRISAMQADSSVLLLEWEDLDPRLGVRRPGDWTTSAYAGIVDSALASLARIQSALDQRGVAPVVLSLPTLPFAPVGHYPGWQANLLQVRIREALAKFETWACSRPSMRVLSSEKLDWISPLSGRYDVSGHVLNGFPYTLSHAAALAEQLALCIRNAPPKKGLITDLDDTLWAGIVGEIGPDQISWDLDHRSHMHGLYQQFLSALASEGALIAAVSKNDPAVVERAFGREDLLINAESVWPMQVQWSVKSEAVSRVLHAWNIGAESVVMVDDSPMELAEVKKAHPEIECLLFKRNDYQAVYALISKLRDLFGKSSVTDEDALRLASLRSSALVDGDGQSMTSDDFLAAAEAEIVFSLRNPPDARALELINKTNQFNLNGRRFTESDWQHSLSRPGAVILMASYRDKYGPLGKILALLGRLDGRELFIDAWVMSCRAFSRRIEYQCIAYLFQSLNIDAMQFDFAPTERNGPAGDFLRNAAGREPEPHFRITRDQFQANCPPLFAAVCEG